MLAPWANIATYCLLNLADLMFSLQQYQSSVAQQVLAGVAAIFLPLTWVAGIYGTNFESENKALL